MTEQLIDGYGRVHRDLRISVTDRCNFRCAYCMPEEGMQWQRREDLLTFEEIERVARIMVERYGSSSWRAARTMSRKYRCSRLSSVSSG